MKREKNAYFLIKACSVCFSITQHMSDQQHWWAHQTKKHLRLAPPPWTVICWRTPSPHVWIVNLNLVPNPHLSRKSSLSTVPPFSSASSLIFICFLVFTPGGRSLTPQARLIRNSTGRGRCLAQENFARVLLKQRRRSRLFPDFTGSSAVGDEHFPGERVPPNLPRPIFYFLFVFDSSSSAAETKWKTQLLPLMNRLGQENQMTFPNSLCYMCVYWETVWICNTVHTTVAISGCIRP